ncbi:hypothetical protein [Marisediminicola senii]|uniref:hypothetical protein n=1 Tax=Marisediminicola senii TaxID=2711233 RepID=UPI0013EA8531|nr:hypothetical protein [Marisediminicola senii]
MSCYLLRLGTSPVGLAITRDANGPERVVSSFFLVRAARGAGHGRTAVDTITRQHPGRWNVAFQDANKTAAAFWRTVASAADNGWTLERLPVPDRPDLPPDSWIRFEVK